MRLEGGEKLHIRTCSGDALTLTLVSETAQRHDRTDVINQALRRPKSVILNSFLGETSYPRTGRVQGSLSRNAYLVRSTQNTFFW